MNIARTPCFSSALASLFVAATLSLPGTATAQDRGAALPAPSDDPVQRAYEEGNQHYDAGRHPEAERAYERAWAIRNTFEVAAQLGGVELEQGKHREAAEHLAWAARHLPPDAGQEIRKHISARLALALEHVAELTLEIAPEGASVQLDGASLGRAPLAEPTFVEPGEHTVAVTLAGKSPEERHFTAQAKERIRLAITLLGEEGKQGPGGEGAPQALSGQVLFGVGASALVLGLAGGIAFTVAANDEAAAAEQARRPSPEHRDMQEDQQIFSNAALWSFVGTGIGAAMAGVGIYLWSAGGDEPSNSAMHITPWITATSTGMWMTGCW